MVKSPDPQAKPEALVVTDPNGAPVIYFDGAPNFGENSGVINVTLAFGRHLHGPNGVQSDVIASAHLRCSIPAAHALIHALQTAVFLAQPSAGGEQ